MEPKRRDKMIAKLWACKSIEELYSLLKGDIGRALEKDEEGIPELPTFGKELPSGHSLVGEGVWSVSYDGGDTVEVLCGADIASLDIEEVTFNDI